jgi:hypothetical protein
VDAGCPSPASARFAACVAASLGILRLAHDFSAVALEQACQRVLALKTYSYRAVRTLIITPPAPTAAASTAAATHDNVRGAGYFT